MKSKIDRIAELKAQKKLELDEEIAGILAEPETFSVGDIVTAITHYGEIQNYYNYTVVEMTNTMLIVSGGYTNYLLAIPKSKACIVTPQ